MRPIGCPETSVQNYYYSLCNNPEERCSHLLHGISLKSHITLYKTVRNSTFQIMDFEKLLSEFGYIWYIFVRFIISNLNKVSYRIHKLLDKKNAHISFCELVYSLTPSKLHILLGVALIMMYDL